VKPSLPQIIGMLAACGGAAAALVSTSPRARYLAIGVALAAALALLVGDVWDQSRFTEFRQHPPLVAAVAVAAAIGICGLAAAFVRFPMAFPVLCFAALPFRVPVQVGGQSSSLLVPLYWVIAAGFVSAVYLAYSRGDLGSRESRNSIGEGPAGLWLRRLLAATLVLYAIQAAYTIDASNAVENISFFLVPFAVMAVLLAEIEWSPRLGAYILAAVALACLLFAVIAFWEYATHDLILNQDLLQENQIHLYFRVNSLFRDPNVLGRYLALTIVGLGAFIAWTKVTSQAVVATGVAAVLLAALALTYSLTSFVALLAGLLVLVALRFSVRWTLAGGGALVLVALALALATGFFNNLNSSTSGRVDLVGGGLDLAGDRPVWGWGSGSFGRAFIEDIHQATTTNSHSEPITVAAEQGGIGIVLYVALVACALVVVLQGAGGSVTRAAVAACFVAMIVHSLGYAGFVIDPATWALLAVALALRRQAATHAEPRAI
jgi:putative inorganic carbon (hco3(-)) transporter